MDSCIKSGYYCGETERMTKAGDNPGMYEMGLRYYPDSEPIRQLINSGTFNRDRHIWTYWDIPGFFQQKLMNNSKAIDYEKIYFRHWIKSFMIMIGIGLFGVSAEFCNHVTMMMKYRTNRLFIS